MPRSRGRNRSHVNEPAKAQRTEEGQRYRQMINWARGLTVGAAGNLVPMARIAFETQKEPGATLTFSLHAGIALLMLAVAYLLVRRAQCHNRRFQHFNNIMPIGARIAPPDRIRRPY